LLQAYICSLVLQFDVKVEDEIEVQRLNDDDGVWCGEFT